MPGEESGKRPREEVDGEAQAQAGGKVAKTAFGYKIISGAYANKGLKSVLEDVEKEVLPVVLACRTPLY
jgi:hypothetical protein